jgi:hypothetical protein
VQIQSLPFSAGALWLRDGWHLLKRQPLGLIAMAMIYSFMVIVPATLPIDYVNLLVPGILSPFATLGFMGAFREVASARLPNPAVFAQALQERPVRNTLFKLGLIHGALLILVSSLAKFLIGTQTMPADQQSMTMENIRLSDFGILGLLYAPVAIAMWFAPMLAGWHGVDVGKAMFGSAIGCWRNKGAIVLYMILITLVLFGVSLFTSAVLGAFFPTQLVPWLAMPIVFALLTLMQAGFYRMYRSIFAESVPA